MASKTTEEAQQRDEIFSIECAEEALVKYLGVKWFDRDRLSSAARGHRPLAGPLDGVQRSSRKSLISERPRGTLPAFSVDLSKYYYISLKHVLIAVLWETDASVVRAHWTCRM